jgi:hypothetical protein
VLTDFGVQIAPSTCYAARDRPPSPRAVRDEELKKEIVRVFEENYSVYGAKKVWWALNREGIRVGRCRVERLMRALGLVGVARGKTIRTTVSDPDAERATDLVKRQFAAGAPNRLWVADFTHVSTWAGTVYVAFAIDVFSRRIVGWSASMSKETDLVLDAIDMGLRLMGISRQRVSHWVGRYLAEGEDGLHDRSSRPHTSPTRTSAQVEAQVVELREQQRRGQDWIGAELGVSARTVSRICAATGCPTCASSTKSPARSSGRRRPPPSATNVSGPVSWSTWTSRRFGASPTGAAGALTGAPSGTRPATRP